MLHFQLSMLRNNQYYLTTWKRRKHFIFHTIVNILQCANVNEKPLNARENVLSFIQRVGSPISILDLSRISLFCYQEFTGTPALKVVLADPQRCGLLYRKLYVNQTSALVFGLGRGKAYRTNHIQDSMRIRFGMTVFISGFVNKDIGFFIFI
jgi:hypothetical protein